MTSLLVGAPSKSRAWILPSWLEYIDAAKPSGVDVNILVLLPENDEESIDLLSQRDDVQLVIEAPEDLRYERKWNVPGEIEKMSLLRNRLLEEVRLLAPDFFLSIDTDILVHPEAISNLMETMESYEADAAASLTYLSTGGTTTTNVGIWRSYGSSFNRGANVGCYPVDILMALKMMRASAYNVDYSPHVLGEDIGWSINCKETGLKFHADMRSPSKHVMGESFLLSEDKRCGY